MHSQCNPTGYVMPFFGGFTNFSPITPEVFWNVYSAEQRYKYLCEWLAALTEYAGVVASELNDAVERLDALAAKYESTVPKLDERVSELEKALDTLITSMLVYDPTKGVYTGSMDQARRMLQILGNPSDEHLTVQTIADTGTTVADLGKVMCGALVNDAFKRMSGLYMPYQEVE